MPHRPSRGAISRVALLAAYSRAAVTPFWRQKGARGWDIVRLLKPRQGKSVRKSGVRTMDLPALRKYRRNIQACPEHNLTRQLIRRQVKENETAPENWVESVIAPFFLKKRVHSECGNHRAISLTPFAARPLASRVLRRLMVARERLTHEHQAAFRPGRGCLNEIFTLRQVLEQCETYQ
ncbi:hypothetical protein T265_00642 [Opisthorchis viverrini]|uniref:Reverse transcriptase domain-containing protein n=1 Tax=Opisthorchis viverrini TaxID=6198 RepID=A0A075A2D3_OPIVI|nr:hypothetical protein T265_00642 [Opisthorchis viverrini]KER33531.1 hypothetical protein T265_00642 [Opisthorchis viverrini]